MRKVNIGRFRLDLRFPVLLTLFSAAILLAIFNQPVAAIGGQERIAYYGNWDIYQNNYFLKNVDTTGAAARLTTLVYSFENIDPTTLQCFQAVKAVDNSESDPDAGDGAGDAWADYQRPFTAAESVNGQADSSSQALKGNFNQLRELKAKHPGLKILLSIGGWTFSKYFSDAAATATSRANFVNSCVDMYIRGNLPTGINGDPSGGQGVAKGIFDGIDIDWEFPASANGHLGNHTSPDDTANYTALLAEFRSQLDAQGTTDGKHYYLTAAVPSGRSDIANIQTSQIVPYLDWAGIMSYDMHGAWESTGPTNFQAPLYPSPSDPANGSGLSVDEAVKAWENGGWPANKLSVGIPFYYRGWSGVPAGSNHGLYQSATGASPAFPITNQAGTANYKELLSAGLLYNTYVDDASGGSPWVYTGSDFYTGDTPASANQKGAYIRDNGLHGAMIYSLEGDDASGTMLKSVVAGLNGGAPAPLPSPQQVQTMYRTASTSQNTATNGEPINMIGGNFLLNRLELSVPDRDNPVKFELSYNSAAADQNGLNGWGWTNSYRITAQTDTDGSVVVQNPDGRMDRFTPDGNGGYVAPLGSFDQLVNNNGTFQVTHKDRSVYNFNSNGLIASIVSPNGNTQTLTYDTNNYLTKLTDAVGRSFTFAYNSDNLLASVTDPSGKVVNYTYDVQGNLTSVKNPDGQSTNYAYDTNHRITKVTDPRGHDVVVNVYDDQGRVTQQTNGLNHTVTLAYAPGQTTYTDANNGQTIYYSDDQMRLTKVQDAMGGVRTISYDSSGNVYQTTDPNNHTTTYAYDTRGNITQITDPAGGIQKFTYDTQDDLLTYTDQLNHTTTYAYDSHGNVTQKTDNEGNITKFTVDANGQTTAVTNPLNNLTGFVYDADGNQVTKTDASNRNTYYGYDGIGRLTALGDADNDTAYYAYDGMDHVTTITDPNGHDTYFTYDEDGNKTQYTDPNGNVTNYEYDANNNLTKVTNALNQITSYTYDNNDNLTQVTDAKNNPKVYAYDLLNRQTQSTDPLGNITKATYDAAGNVKTRTDASNRTTTYDYDSLDRLTTVTYPDSTTMSYTYDAAGNVLTATNSAGTTTYTYDDLGRLASVTDPHNAKLTYGYDIANELRQVTYPDGKVVSYTYTPSEQLSTVTDWNNTTTSYLYDNDGRLAQKNYPNTFIAYYTYDANGNLTDLTYDKNNNLFTDFSYSRDANGNITEDDELRSNGTEYYSAYTYDALNEVTQDDAPANTWDYTYDAVGNMATSVADGTTTNYAYNAANQLTSKGSRTFTYDKQGNEVTDNAKSLGYNFDNMLKSYTSGTTTTNFVYDATGNRIEKNGATNYQYVNDGNNNVVVAKNVTAGTSNFYLYGSDMISQGAAGSTSRQYYLTDGLGNVKYLTNSSGTVLNRYSYDPFGGNQTNSGTTANNYTYQDEQKDTESNLVYLRARYYDQTTGRFTSTDPSSGVLTDPLTQNGYNYASNNPINMMDPYGMFSMSSVWNGFQSLTGLDKYQAAIASGCSWGAIASSGGMAILDMGTVMPGEGEVDLGAQAAVRGLMGAVKAEKIAKAAEVTDDSMQALREQLSMEEAIGNAAIPRGDQNKMIIPTEGVKDPLYQGFEKWQYQHIGIDKSKITVHYMYNPASKAVEQVKIP